MEDRFSLFNVRDILGITQGKLQNWVGRGYIRPSIKRARGHGDRNYFSRDDLYKIALFDKLVPLAIYQTAALAILQHADFSRVKDGIKYLHIWRSPFGKTAWEAVTEKNPRAPYDDEWFVITINLQTVVDFVDRRLP